METEARLVRGGARLNPGKKSVKACSLLLLPNPHHTLSRFLSPTTLCYDVPKWRGFLKSSPTPTSTVPSTYEVLKKCLFNDWLKWRVFLVSRKPGSKSGLPTLSIWSTMWKMAHRAPASNINPPHGNPSIKPSLLTSESVFKNFFEMKIWHWGVIRHISTMEWSRAQQMLQPNPLGSNASLAMSWLCGPV